MRLLIIDDEWTTFEIIKTTINWESLQIIPEYVDSVVEAVEIIQTDPPDIILTDIVMPDMTGLELVEWIKSNNYLCEIIVLSAYSKFEYAKKAIEMGILGYLLKPIQEKELEELLLKAVKNIHERKKSEIPPPLSDVIDENFVFSIEKAKQYIKNHYTENIKLEDISQYAAVSKNYFCAVFKKKTGLTIWEYLTNIRMEKAKELILNFPLKNYEIASKIGYDDPAYFGRLFKRYTGFNPSEYKEKYQKD